MVKNPWVSLQIWAQQLSKSQLSLTVLWTATRGAFPLIGGTSRAEGTNNGTSYVYIYTYKYDMDN